MPTAPKKRSISEKKCSSWIQTASFREDHGKPIFGCSFSPYTPGQSILATVGGDRVTVYECADKTNKYFNILQQFRDGNDENFYCCAWLYCPESDRHILAAAGIKGVIRVLSPADGNSLAPLIGHGDAVNELRTHPRDSVILASVGKDYTVRLWNVVRDLCVAKIGGCEAHRDQVLSADFDDNGYRLASGSMDHSIKVWDLSPSSPVGAAITASHTESRTEFKQVPVGFPIATTTDLHTNYVDCVRWLGSFLISKSSENIICLWKFGELDDMDSPTPNDSKVETNVTLLRQLDLPNMELWFSKFGLDPTGKFLVASNRLGLVNLWVLDRDLPNKSPQYLLREGCKTLFRQLEFSNDGKILVGVADDCTVWRWDLDVKQPALVTIE